MTLLTLSRVYRTDKKKDGTLLKDKRGNPYERIGILTKEHGETWLGGFDPDGWTKEWKEGDTVEVNIEETEWNGKKQLNFRKISRLDLLEARVRELEAKMQKKNSY